MLLNTFTGVKLIFTTLLLIIFANLCPRASGEDLDYDLHLPNMGTHDDGTMDYEQDSNSHNNEEACNLDDKPDYHQIYCECNSNIVKCNAWGTPKDPERVWSLMSHLKYTSRLEFTNRPDGALKSFPSPIVFTEMNLLTDFTMKYSAIQSLHPFTFGNSSSVSEIVLKDNGIRRLEENSFANMKNLSKISLGQNMMAEINRNVFLNLPKLKSLFLNENRIQIIHDQAFRDLGSLEELDLKRNNLSVIVREVFAGLKNLNKLELQVNAIEYLGDHVFADMPQLQELDLHKNQIRSLSSMAFHNLKKLNRLNLQGNKIISLETPTFSQMAMVYQLDLRENALETLSGGLIEPIYENLRNESMQLLLGGNRFKCDCRILWMPKLYQETQSPYVKNDLEKITCDMFHVSGHQKHEHQHQTHRHVMHGYNENVTLETVSPEETTTYAFDGTKNVIQLNPSDFKCHDHHQKDSPDSVSASLPHQQDNNGQDSLGNGGKKVQQSHHQSHVDIGGSSGGRTPQASLSSSFSTRSSFPSLTLLLIPFVLGGYVQ